MKKDTLEFYWLVGILEGEGSFQKPPPSQPNRPRVVLRMTDMDIVERASKQLGHHFKKYKGSKDNYKDIYEIRMTGKKAVSAMKTLYPYMGRRRKEQIEKALVSIGETLPRKLRSL